MKHTYAIATAVVLSHSPESVDANGFSARNAWSLGRNVNGIVGMIQRKQEQGRLRTSSLRSSFRPTRTTARRNGHGHRKSYPRLELMDEVCDCFENDARSPEAIYATAAEPIIIDTTRDAPSKSLKSSVQKLVRGCYAVCPGEAYYSNMSSSSTSALYNDDTQSQTLLASLRTLKERVQNIAPRTNNMLPAPATKKGGASATLAEDGEETLIEPSQAILSGIVRPLIPTNIWNSLTGREFFFPSVLSALVQTGIQTVLPESNSFIEWKPADTTTKKLLELNDEEAVQSALLADENILVWIGKFKNDGHGSHLPLVKTTSILPLAPRDMAALLMDSEQVTSYNKMSLGRNDEVVFQEGIDQDADGSAMGIAGEAKIVRNLTKPPLSKKLMDFVTVMYARRLKADDNVGIGVMGGSYEGGYAVVSRAVSGGRWGNGSQDEEESERTRSEILLGMNLIRTIPGEENKCEVTAVTHCNSPSVPKILARSVGVKGAVDFVRDIRAMFDNYELRSKV